MAKENGLGWTVCAVDDELGAAQELKTSVNSLEYATPRNVLEVTGLDKSAMERLHGLADFSATLNFTWDDATSNSPHDVFKDLSNVRTLTLTVSASTLANEVLFTDYNLSRGDDGKFGGTAPCVLQSGIVPVWT